MPVWWVSNYTLQRGGTFVLSISRVTGSRRAMLKRKRSLWLPRVVELGHNFCKSPRTRLNHNNDYLRFSTFDCAFTLLERFSEFTFLLAEVLLDRCNCVVLELPMTQPPLPKHIFPAALLQQVPNNVFLRRHTPISCFPKFRTVAQEIITV